MIRIDKGPAPQKLVDVGTALVAQQKIEFEGNENVYLSGKSFKITDDYKMDVVKATLLERQYNKCCFSEALFSGDYAQVEHFRPKARVDLLDSKERLYPGYYWLAYDWSNLLLCKQLINCSYKRNFFPLVDEVKRNRSHKDTGVEENVLIDPAAEDPRQHIKFYKEEPRPITERGKQNIELLGLRDSSFTEARAKLYKILSALKTLVDAALQKGIPKSDSNVAESLGILRDAVKPTAEFSSMAIDLLSGWPPLLSDQDSA